MDALSAAAGTCLRGPRAPPIVRSSREPDPAFGAALGRLAVRSLYAELILYPKPGLVSLADSGSHDDMTAATFMRSLFALRHYFIRITLAGMADAPFPALKRLGMDAEQRMLAATGGINTHRGVIFCMGLLCAAIGSCRTRGIARSAPAIRARLLEQWGPALAGHARPEHGASHGLRAAQRYAVSGAREEAALGLPSVFELALPAMQQTLAAGRGWRKARIDALFALMAHIDDTNIYHRGGAGGALIVRRHARQFLALGGTAHPGWDACARDCHRIFVEHRLSPGGAADLLAAACLVHEALRPPCLP